MDTTTIINDIRLLSPENMEEFRLFLNALLKKQEETSKRIEPDAPFSMEDEDIIPLNPLEL